MSASSDPLTSTSSNKLPDVQGIGYNWWLVPCAERALSAKPQGWLQRLNLAFHTVEQRLLCKTCHCFIPLEHTIVHATGAGNSKGKLPTLHSAPIPLSSLGTSLKDTQKALLREFQSYGQLQEPDNPYPSTHSYPHPDFDNRSIWTPVEGVTITDGWICSLCEFAAMSEIHHHIHKQHPMYSGWRVDHKARVQTLYLQHQVYFPVMRHHKGLNIPQMPGASLRSLMQTFRLRPSIR